MCTTDEQNKVKGIRASFPSFLNDLYYYVGSSSRVERGKKNQCQLKLESKY